MTKKATIYILFGFMGAFLSVLFSNCSGGAPSKSSQQSSLSKICNPGPGASGSPRTIEDVVVLINSLPKPVSIGCFLESLDRPLDIYGTFSSSSAQPSDGPSDPRIFIFKNTLAISVVTNGAAQEFMEFGLMLPGNVSQKGELKFPIQNELSITAPFDEIRSNGGTGCVFCHANERPGPSPNSFVSEIIRPSSFTRVSLDAMKTESALCNSASGANTHRCSIFKGIFNYGQVRGKDFP
ncbi:MAG: hypothetical protein IPM97_04225 [Bdellovibrionaceae bacterium]|nr:hypothetical protein [Pseudobdellovibrionaceae bacterium]